jgi:hypothetical protein
MKRPPSLEDVVEWGSAGAALERDSGDVHVVTGFPGGALVALVDGLGHGFEAAEAAQRAAAVLQAFAGEPVIALVERCHEALRKTRGAVMSVASFHGRDSSMTWVAVGNVEGVLVRARKTERRQSLALRGGVVGYQLPALRASTLSVSRGDTLVLATDGIRSAFPADLTADGDPQAIADSILARYGRGTDDALVVVARYVGVTG